MAAQAKKQAQLLEAKNVLTVDNPWIKSAEERARMTLACRDGENIPRVADAGEVKTYKGEQVQIMHNGLRVKHTGYQGDWQAEILKGLKGIHEPQEELVFHEVLKRLGDKSTMMELGAWWAYYSMWFLKEKKSSYAYCGEPDPDNLVLGRANMALNGFEEGKRFSFIECASGAKNNQIISFTTEAKTEVTVPIRTVDSLVKEHNIAKLDLLHMDIQGAELDALKGAENTIKEKKIRFIFISTHHYTISGDPIIHQKCIKFLKRHGAHIVAKHTILESCSGDGLIVASFDPKDNDFTVQVSLQPSDDSLFRTAEEDTALLWESTNNYLARINELQAENEKLRDEVRKEKQIISEKEHQVSDLQNVIDDITPLRKHVGRQIKSRLDRNISKDPTKR